MPGPLPAIVTHVEQYSTGSEQGFCDFAALPLGEGTGNVAMPVLVASDHPGWNILNPSGAQIGGIGFWNGDLFQQPTGFIGYSGSSNNQVEVAQAFGASGNFIRSTTVVGRGDAFAPDPNGGLFLVGHFAMSFGEQPSKKRVALMINADGTLRYGPFDFPNEAAIFGAGVDVKGRTLVILDGGPGRISGLWMEANGKTPVVSSVFPILTGFQPGQHTWFETSPLAFGGLAVRRMDAPSERSDEHRRTSQWVAVVRSGVATGDPVPDWLANRPNTRMEFARGHRDAYAFLPWSADVSSCHQQLEIVALSGAACGKIDFPIDDQPCRTHDLRLGFDGTVLQTLPADREKNTPPNSSVFTCTLRYWPGALR